MTQVEVDEMFRLVSHIATEVATDDAVPRRVVLFIEFLLDVGGDVLLYVILLHGLGGTVDSVLLHVLRHVGIFDYSLSFRHGTVNRHEFSDTRDLPEVLKNTMYLR